MHAPATPTGKQVAIVQRTKVDRDAVAIGKLWRKACQSLIDSNRYYIECGQRLLLKKANLPRGEKWLSWLKANREALGFESITSTPQRLMQAAMISNSAPARNLTVADAVAFNRVLWGHKLHRTLGTGNDEWHTPQDYIDAAREVLGSIDLDPASNADAQRTVRAARYFSKRDNGLAQDWHGKVWLNPPYGQQMADFVAKLIAEYQAGHVIEAILLTHAFTDPAWFQAAIGAARVFCLTRGRVRFVDWDGELASPTQGQALFFFGPDAARFIEVFRPFGKVVKEVDRSAAQRGIDRT